MTDDHRFAYAPNAFANAFITFIVYIQTCFESKSFPVFSISEQICNGCNETF
jgi:hypothetical protein